MKTFVMTGGTSGLGKVAAQQIPRHSPARRNGGVLTLINGGSLSAPDSPRSVMRGVQRTPSGLPGTRRYHHLWTFVGERWAGAGASLGWSTGCDRACSQVATGSGRWRGRGGDVVGKAVGHCLVVHPPATEVRPRLLGGAFHGKPNGFERRDGCRQLFVLQLDRAFRIRVGIDSQPSDLATRFINVNPIRRHSPACEGAVLGTRTGALHRHPVPQETDHPGQPRLGGAEEQQDRVGGVALRRRQPTPPMRRTGLEGYR